MESTILTPPELRRYNRHIILPEIGIEGQEKLKKAKVLVIGAGGLGSPILQYLTAAGVGTIGIADNDTVSEDNLQRQVLYGIKDIGKLKAIIAKQRLEDLNPLVDLIIYNIRITTKNIEEILKNYEIIVDATDNFETRYLINDTCVKFNKPLVFGSIYKFEGQLSVFNYHGGPNYRNFYPDSPQQDEAPDPSNIGLIGVLPGIIGSMQANEVIKIITDIGEVISGKILVFNILNLSSYFFTAKK